MWPFLTRPFKMLKVFYNIQSNASPLNPVVELYHKLVLFFSEITILAGVFLPIIDNSY